MSARILLVDDHQMMRDGLRMLLCADPGLEIVGDAADSESAWQAVNSLRPDLVVMDIDMPGAGGIALTRRLREAFPEIKVVILTAHTEEQFVSAALRAGACGYLLKNNAGAELLTAVRAALAGQVFLCPESSTIVVREYQRQLGSTDSGALSGREIEILKLIADGQNTKEIAFALQVSPKTIETHRINIMAKLGVDSVAKLTKYAVREGLTTL